MGKLKATATGGVKDEITPTSQPGDVITIRTSQGLDQQIDADRRSLELVEFRLISRAEAVRRLILIGLGTVNAAKSSDPKPPSV